METLVKRRRALIALLVLVLLGTAGMGGWWYQNIYQTNNDANPVPVYTPSASSQGPVVSTASSTPLTPAASSAPKASSAPSTSSAPAPGCSAQGQPIVPTKFTIDQMNVNSSVLSLGWEDGAAAAPPKNDATGVGWFNVGPKPGSDKGKVLLTIHTYRTGNALGNRLNDPDKGLKKGDVIRLSDGKRTMCYSFDSAMKVFVKDYDPQSGVIYDYSGKPQVVIVICWDYSWQKRDWESRILFYATPMFTT